MSQEANWQGSLPGRESISEKALRLNVLPEQQEPVRLEQRIWRGGQMEQEGSVGHWKDAGFPQGGRKPLRGFEQDLI